ncbi:hypothetical protein G7Y89_g7502 [Cudoniella acicularis]|uniref:Fe2OG dioxygenase domain-containing protein n=1 Tax=Cudoniella acicularis TaxID=354080 RepID=A0A8H4RKT6_9HELO|nr:hypothetical protein G7Y89_g7502 [Cudoniella acicularis]
MDKLKQALNGYQSSYCCGGRIPISAGIEHSHSEASAAQSPIKAPPISLRWDVSEPAGHARAIRFPLNAGMWKGAATQSSPIDLDEPALHDNPLFEEPLKTYAPATFGLSGKNILDETYRMAGKLDRSEFSVDLHPHDFEIVDTITQILLPDALAALARAFRRIGGGKFRITHEDNSTFFDWSNDSPNSIQWAAFYSDCEHEILEVEEGHRVTLTYNLYVSEQIGGPLQNFPIVDPALFPLFEAAKGLMSDPNFFKDGFEAIIFRVFRALGLTVRLRPILYRDTRYEDYGPSSDSRENKELIEARAHGRVSIVGQDFHKMGLVDVGNYEKSLSEIYDMAYGNQAELTWDYSHAAILVEVPDFNQRNNVLALPWEDSEKGGKNSD